MAPSFLAKRYCGDFYGDCDGWWSSDGYYVRYAIVAAVFAVIVLFIIFAYLHAQRRMKRGLPPLAYHRWLVRRRSPYPPQNTYVYYSHGPNGPNQPAQVYPMNAHYGGPPPPAPIPQQGQPWVPPPPAYGQHNWDADVPPTYAPPAGASKAAANQNVEALARENGEGSAGLPAPQPAYQAPTARNEHTQ